MVENLKRRECLAAHILQTGFAVWWKFVHIDLLLIEESPIIIIAGPHSLILFKMCSFRNLIFFS